MVEKAFIFNKDAKYTTGGVHAPNTSLNLAETNIQVGTGTQGFTVKLPDIFSQYRLPKVSNDTILHKWSTAPMSFWQNQLNWAIWCASTGCGVSMKHLSADDPMTAALFRFHVYYQTRRILAELKCALPEDTSWNAFENSYDQRAFERICAEFKIPLTADWHQKRSMNNGLGTVYFYVTRVGYRPSYIPYSKIKDGTYLEGKMSFTQKTTNSIIHIDYVEQGSEADGAWSTFILDEPDGFTQAGVERLNDSIRTYVWAILGAQAQTRTGILGTGTAFDAQKQFLANIEDAISAPVDLPSAIKRYQDVLRYARSKVDFVFGIGLYMAPSDMDLQIGKGIQGYNNEIVVAEAGQVLGINKDVNSDAVPQPYLEPKPSSSTTVSTAVTHTPAQEGPGAAAKTDDVRGWSHDIIESPDPANDHTGLVFVFLAMGLGTLLFFELARR